MAVPFLDIFVAPPRDPEAPAAHDAPLPGSAPAFHASAEPEPPLDLSLAGHFVYLVVIFVLSVLTIEFARLSNQIATIWPANAVMLAMVLRHTRSPINYLSLVVGGSAATGLASLLIGNGPVLSSALFATNIVEVGSALALLTIFQIKPSNLASFRGILVFIVVAGGVAPLASTLLSALAYGWSFGRPWFVVWRNWYPGHALGMIIVVPFLISVMSPQWRALRIKQQISGSIAVFAVFIAIGLCATYFRPGIFAVAPAILLATVRFGVIGATASTFAIAIVASAFALLDIGQPFLQQPEVTQRVFALQMFLAITSFWSLPTAALLAERDRLLHGLARANKQLTAESERKSHLVTGLRRHLSMAEENERLRLSHELHDQAGQSLIAAILELNEIDALTTGPAHERLRHLRKKMEEMGGTLHRIAWELRPPSIDELGLRKALASYIAEWSAQCGTEVDFHCDDPSLDEVPDEIATAVYRVVQEGLTNIVKHAHRPSDVSVVIRQPDATLQVIVEDNGCGFDTVTLGGKGGNHRGLGLDGMRERLALLGGTLVVESAVGAGTTLFARIDLDGQRSAA
jgi:signal transduction histidine kinase